MRLTKEQSLLRWQGVRDLWCGWDPIGVMGMADWPRDEYDSYLGPTLRLLETGASLQHIEGYLKSIEIEHMGLNGTPKASSARLAFAAKLREWYEKYWSGTFV